MELGAWLLGLTGGDELTPIRGDRPEFFGRQSAEVIHHRQGAAFGVGGGGAVAQDHLHGVSAAAFA